VGRASPGPLGEAWASAYGFGMLGDAIDANDYRCSGNGWCDWTGDTIRSWTVLHCSSLASTAP